MKRVLANGFTTAAAVVAEVSAGAVGQTGPFQSNLHVTGVLIDVGSSVASTIPVTLRYGNSSAVALSSIVLGSVSHAHSQYIPLDLHAGYVAVVCPTTVASGFAAIIYGK